MIDVTTLRDQARGPVLRPGDDGFDAACGGFQLLDPHRPDAVLVAADERDVRVAVNFAAERGVPLAVQATGHGRNVGLDGGLLLATGALTAVRVDPADRTAWVSAGATWRQVIDATAPYGLAPLSGSFPALGAVSYTLGGGIGLLSRRYGFAADRVRQLDVVTPDGELRHVTADTEPDLYWGLRGGGGNLGVVTGMRIELLPVARVYGGALAFDVDADPGVLAGWWRWTRDLPDELTSAVSMLGYPDLPVFPAALRGRHIAKLQLCWCGPAEQGERLIAPLRELGECVQDSVGELPYAESGSIFAEPERPHPYRSSPVLLSALDADRLDALRRDAGAAPVMCVVGIRHLGGAMARPPRVPNAVGHRDAAYLLSVLSPVDADAGTVADTHRRLTAPWQPDAVGRPLNFSFGPLAPREVLAGFDEAAQQRLAELRARFDPAHTLRPHHPIPTPR
ncbi:FAD-dependent oxidoreductase [Actinocatenispora thailandica]|uniref:FAD-binding oxidoreductase n=1 Tax=Actinocatenispora thailandica TaxID=227318 RepID=UPI0031E27C42